MFFYGEHMLGILINDYYFERIKVNS